METKNKKIVKRIVITVIINGFIVGCNSIDKEYIESNLWQYEKGFQIGKGDFVEFQKLGIYTISNDTIFIRNQPIVIVTKLDKKTNEMTIRSIETKAVGIYVNTDEFRK